MKLCYTKKVNNFIHIKFQIRDIRTTLEQKLRLNY